MPTDFPGQADENRSIHVEIAALRDDVSALVGTVRDLAATVAGIQANTDRQFRDLYVAVAAAAGPRRTDWGTLISAAAFCLALGAAVLSPLYMRVSEQAFVIERIMANAEKHLTLRLHPVGEQWIAELDRRTAADMVHVNSELVEMRALLPQVALLNQRIAEERAKELRRAQQD